MSTVASSCYTEEMRAQARLPESTTERVDEVKAKLKKRKRASRSTGR